MTNRRQKTSGLYASGIAAPFKGDSDGGVNIAEGPDYVADQVFAAVSVNSSDNPFQDLGTTEREVFQNPDDPTWRRILQERIKSQFVELERNNLARLVRVRFQRADDGEGDFFVSVIYVNLETNSEQVSTFQQTQEGSESLRPVR